MKLNQFPHVILLSNKDVKFKEFDETINLNIESFEKSFKTWITKKDAGMLKQLHARSEVLAQHIFNYYVIQEEPATEPVEIPEIEPIELPITEPITEPAPPAPEKPLSKNEQALKNLFDNNITDKISVEILRKEGFDTGINSPLGMRGCKVGLYELSRSGANHYKLIKHG